MKGSDRDVIPLDGLSSGGRLNRALFCEYCLLQAVQGDPVRTVTSNCNGTDLCVVRGPSLVRYVSGVYSLVVATKRRSSL